MMMLLPWKKLVLPDPFAPTAKYVQQEDKMFINDNSRSTVKLLEPQNLVKEFLISKQMRRFSKQI